ncbi:MULTISPECIES: helix-turn-helix domain-containing protein [unclassified Streptomyces]|uniref:helix-turn-helix domain-containing protein n=1 Tax=unclassified Streptomyces TaxID=2593676 RepID=UPI00225479E3|nr:MULTISPECIES: helix-turn-helix domain-containing protein [unclassified Streptomyces]MCX4988967.1 helix-turn-helix domain-containing protein [Streptomyces sp. NBC_00568]MCX5005811.1 helix-turn-helix domain-containing protein [Streptomyces sp. NBC_00638]
MTQSPATPLPAPEERRRLREDQSLTQTEMAARLGVSRATVRSWETGRTTPRGRKREAYVRLLTADPAHSPAEVNARQEETSPELVGAGATPAHETRSADGETRSADSAERSGDSGERSGDSGERSGEGDERPGGSGKRSARDRKRPAEGTGPSATDRERAAAAKERLAEGRQRPAEDGDSALPEPSLTPAQAFDALYAFCAPALVRQTYLLTGRRELARESVERAFQLAWHRWPEVAVDRDPAGWVRATAYEYALSPWHRLRPRYRHPEAPPAGAADRALLDVLLDLPPVYRRTLLLYDGVGLGLPETAAETEASTPAAANRVLHAREAVAARLPELAVPEELHWRLAELASSERLRAAKPRTVRWHGERRAQQWTRAAIAFTVLLVGVTALTMRTAPDHYEAPLAPPETIHGLPPRAAPGPLSAAELKLRAKLKAETARGPERLIPEVR